jgi:hypothetical protein
VVFHDHEELLAGFVARLAARSPSETTFDLLRAWVLALVVADDLESARERARRRLIRETPSLAARERADMARFEAVLVPALALDLGVGEDSLQPHLAGAAAMAVLAALGRRRDELVASRATATPAEVLDEAMAFLEAGLAAYAR